MNVDLSRNNHNKQHAVHSIFESDTSRLRDRCTEQNKQLVIFFLKKMAQKSDDYLHDFTHVYIHMQRYFLCVWYEEINQGFWSKFNQGHAYHLPNGISGPPE